MPPYTVNCTHAPRAEYAAITSTKSMFNGHDRTILVILASYSIRLHDDGSFMIRNMLKHF